MKKMWTYERPDPLDRYRSTIFKNEKRIKNQYANISGKRWKQDIVDQNSYMFAWNNPQYDRSLVAAPTQKMRVEKYIQSHNNPHKQRDTIFSTPSVLSNVANYKSLESKKHYANIYNSSNMQGVLDYAYPNTKDSVKNGRGGFNQHKNASSVGNPILYHREGKEPHNSYTAKRKGEYSKDLYSTTGNFRPNDCNPKTVKEINIESKHAAINLAGQQSKHVFRQPENKVQEITRQLIGNK